MRSFGVTQDVNKDTRDFETHSTHGYVADAPIPTPPPMADLQMTSRLDYPSRRRLLNSLSSDFGRSPLLSRTNAFGTRASVGRNNLSDLRHTGSCYTLHSYEKLRSPMTGRKNVHFDLTGSSKLRRSVNSVCGGGSSSSFREYFPRYEQESRRGYETWSMPRQSSMDFPKRCEKLVMGSSFVTFGKVSNTKSSRKDRAKKVDKKLKSKYISSDSDLHREYKEVNDLSVELQGQFKKCSKVIPQGSTSQRDAVFKEHYISDIDENEEIKQFCYGYADRRYSDTIKTSYPERISPGFRTLPSMSSFKDTSASQSSACDKSETVGSSFSSLKSSEFEGPSPCFSQTSDEGLQPAKVLKSPRRTVVKLAKIR